MSSLVVAKAHRDDGHLGRHLVIKIFTTSEASYQLRIAGHRLKNGLTADVFTGSWRPIPTI